MKDNNKYAAFTLVELIMVIILIGIIAIIGTIGLGSAVSSDRAIYARQFESAIRYTQQYAMSHFSYGIVVFTPVAAGASQFSGYQIYTCVNGAPNPLTSPLSQTSANFTVSFNYGINYYSSISSSISSIAFNSEGQPGVFSSSSTQCSSAFTLLTSNEVEVVSFAPLPPGTPPTAPTFYIYPNTGLISSEGTL